MYERSYVVSSDGNVSVRLDDDRILATPTMTCKGRMTEDLIAITDLDGRALNDRRASSELAMHLLIYRERPEIKAVCHAHPPHGTAFAVAGFAVASADCTMLLKRIAGDVARPSLRASSANVCGSGRSPEIIRSAPSNRLACCTRPALTRSAKKPTVPTLATARTIAATSTRNSPARQSRARSRKARRAVRIIAVRPSLRGRAKW